MADYRSCPRCGHSFKKSMMSSYASMFRCNGCGAVFCYNCNGGSDSSPLCPNCGKRDTASRDGKLLAVDL